MIRLKSLLKEQVMLTAEQEAWLNECCKKSIGIKGSVGSSTWSADNLGYVTVKGSFDCSGMQLTDFKGVKFQLVIGDFECNNNNLTSLEGAPKKVTGGFQCMNNNLTSLKGAPTYVGMEFSCHGNNLTSLEGVPQQIGGKCINCNFMYPSTLGTPAEVKVKLKEKNVKIPGEVISHTMSGTDNIFDSVKY